jgi:hypothetical protein
VEFSSGAEWAKTVFDEGVIHIEGASAKAGKLRKLGSDDGSAAKSIKYGLLAGRFQGMGNNYGNMLDLSPLKFLNPHASYV